MDKSVHAQCELGTDLVDRGGRELDAALAHGAKLVDWTKQHSADAPRELSPKELRARLATLPTFPGEQEPMGVVRECEHALLTIDRGFDEAIRLALTNKDPALRDRVASYMNREFRRFEYRCSDLARMYDDIHQTKQAMDTIAARKATRLRDWKQLACPRG